MVIFLSMGLFDQVEIAPDAPKMEAEAAQTLSEALAHLERSGLTPHPWTHEMFTDPQFFNALPERIQGDPQILGEYIAHCNRFYESLYGERLKNSKGDTSGLLGPVIEAPSVPHQDGRVRDAESGKKINVPYLRTIGIDPSKVLFFRVTQPSVQPKPEYYWTSDYFETTRGLTAEIPSAQRRTAVILVADLETLDARGGLIQDINDDGGLPVRQLGLDPFDQKEALATIHPNRQ